MPIEFSDRLVSEFDKYSRENAVVLHMKVIEQITSAKGTEYLLMMKLNPDSGPDKFYAFDVDEFLEYQARNGITGLEPRLHDKVLFALSDNPYNFHFYKRIYGVRRKVIKISWSVILSIGIWRHLQQSSLEDY